ncbi:unnamed protein product [Clonostachys solani]|uniref:F-box domain-containing protein n=1 Tax=Clonostachys solani TaxID=160281 RepID=A0A9N9WBQ2_9HYPO|nr:unnamed protein product [Clonostachys solani]
MSPLPIPPEILIHIITLLDPLGVWSLSQTCRYLRHVIRPGRNEKLALLLQWEGSRLLGGGTNLFIGNSFNPSSDLSLWERNLWVCSGCMTFLRHQHFNNHSLLKLGYRKLDPETSRQHCLTTWRPTLRGKKRGQEGPKYSASNEHARHGAKRHLRLCNECLFRQGKLKYQHASIHGFHGGTASTPIQVSRCVRFVCALDRYFPKVGRSLGHPEPEDDLFADHLREEIASRWVLYMIRCPDCSLWQELSSFRVGGSFPSWSPTHDGHGLVRYRGGLNQEDFHIDELCCHMCLFKRFGFSELCVDLLDWYGLLMKSTRFHIDQQLLSGWSTIRRNQRRFSRQYKKDIRRLLQDTEHMYHKRYRANSELGYLQVALVQFRHREFKEIWEKMMETDSHIAYGEMGIRSGFMFWLNDFDKCLETWRWLRACQDAVESNPGLLGWWALCQPRLHYHGVDTYLRRN